MNKLDSMDGISEVDEDTKEMIIEHLIAKYWMYCPVCGYLVEKDGGCNYVKCHCGAEFCWVCGLQKFIEQGCNNKEHNSHYFSNAS